ncbi:MepB family protein [Flavobacterium sp. KACC 22758]|uniref:MepB family protein n=1 Tax=Flavobacterium sp. KACC 22758 TaxID=3025667 RepID=UPI00236598E2|nr:MepB family protein [Flavobacterium sp. KACC 22758]WDF58875.1 MepB family protein [Flavobacterium sp. KACC 22758]
MTFKNNWKNLSLPKNLLTAKELVYDICGFECSEPQPEKESQEYDAFDFKIGESQIKFRSAKITPTKTGQFVTLWKRNINGIIEPFDYKDDIDFVIVSVQKEDLLGQFIFPKEILLKKGVFTSETKEGIRATRVYPPWDETTSKQAQKTQKWQLDYFLSVSDKTDLNRAKHLLDKK